MPLPENGGIRKELPMKKESLYGKKLLMVTPYTPDNQGVGVSYTSQLLKELAKTCIIDLVYFRYKEEQTYTPPNPNIRVIYEKVLHSKDKIIYVLKHPSIFPLFTSRHDKSVVVLLQKRVEEYNYDYLYFDFSQTFSLANEIEHPNKILMSHDVIAQKYSRMKRVFRPWAMFSERKMLKAGRIVFTFSEKDCLLIKNLYGVESKPTTFFLNPNVIAAEPTEESNYFVFFGNWSRVENIEALEWFLDNVYDCLPKMFNYKVIGGGRMPEAMKQKLIQAPNVEYVGFVDDPYKIIANAKAVIASLHMGAGVKVKCVEALGSGTPIIGTEVAFEGIGEKYRGAMFLANAPEEYASIITSFNFPLEKKQQLKRFFIESYNNKQVLRYINEG